jgi:hypothetical protein
VGEPFAQGVRGAAGRRGRGHGLAQLGPHRVADAGLGVDRGPAGGAGGQVGLGLGALALVELPVQERVARLLELAAVHGGDERGFDRHRSLLAGG